MVWCVEDSKKPKSWPSWVTSGIAIVAIVVAVVLVVGVVRYAAGHKAKTDAQIHGMGENELWIYRASGVFADDARHPASKGVVMVGETNADVETKVLVSSVDNITVEYRTDGKDFATIRLTGRAENGSAEGAVILVPANDSRYYERVRREVHELHTLYEECPTCNPGKK